MSETATKTKRRRGNILTFCFFARFFKSLAHSLYQQGIMHGTGPLRRQGTARDGQYDVLLEILRFSVLQCAGSCQVGGSA